MGVGTLLELPADRFLQLLEESSAFASWFIVNCPIRSFISFTVSMSSMRLIMSFLGGLAELGFGRWLDQPGLQSHTSRRSAIRSSVAFQ